MEPDANSTFLTPVINIQTTTAFPEIQQDGVKFASSADRKISLRICSEFMQHLAAVELEQQVTQLALYNDQKGQPIIFGIKATDASHDKPASRRLVVFVHVDGAPHAWQAYDITPGKDVDGNTEVETFASHLAQDESKFHLAVALKASDGLSDLHHATILVPDLLWDITTLAVTPDFRAEVMQVSTDVVWKNISQIGSDRRKIASLACGPSKIPHTFSAPFQISVGTAAISGFRASCFLVDPSPTLSKPWKSMPIPSDSKGVLQMAGAKTNLGNGTFVRYHSPESVSGGLPGSANKTEIVQFCLGEDGKRLDSPVLILEKIDHKVNHMASCVNVHDFTDLFVASDKGIAFYPWSEIRTTKPQIILPEFKFRQVFASEDLDPSFSEEPADIELNFSNITVFAVTDQQELYFIRGKRMLHTQEISFEASGLHLRTRIEDLACFYNGQRNIDEMVYVSENSSRLVHLARDSSTLCWREHTIGVPHESATHEYPAYLSTITVTDSEGTSLGAGYELELTAESTFVNINSKIYTLDQRPTRVKTDSSGRVTIVSLTDSSLEASTIEISLPMFGNGQKYACHPTQRVMRILSTMKDEQSIRNARSTTGKDPFAASKIDTKTFDGNVKSSAGMLSALPSMVHQVDPAAAKAILPQHAPETVEIVKSWARNAEGVLEPAGNEWLLKLGEAVHFIGDAIEWIKEKVQTIFRAIYRCAVKVLVGAVEFVVEVGGKVVRWVVSKVGPLVRCIANFLKDYLGIDINGMLEWLALMFDTKMIKETQEKLTGFVRNLQTHTETFFDVNESTIKDSFEALREKLKPIIKDYRPAHDASKKGQDNPGLTALRWMLDNPVLAAIRKYSPIFWILDAEDEGAMEGLGDSLKIPDCTILFRTMEEVTKTIVDENVVAIWDLLAEVWDGLQATLADPSQASKKAQSLLFDTFWTIFDAVKSVIVGAYKLVAAVVEQFFEVLKGEWKVPLLSETFKAWADQPFSFLNLATYWLAQIMHIFFEAIFKKKPFEVLGDPSDLFTGWTKDTLDLHDFLGIPRQSDNTTTMLMATAPQEDSVNNMSVLAATKNVTVRAAGVDDSKYKAYRAAIEWHNRVSPWIAMISVAGQVSSSMIGIASLKHFKAKFDRRIAARDKFEFVKDDAYKKSSLRQATCIMSFAGSSLILIGRATQMGIFLRAMELSPTLKEEWDTPELKCGYVIPMVFSLFSTTVQLMNFKVGSQELTILGNCMHQLGDLAQQICLYYVFKPPASQDIKDDPWDNQVQNANCRIVADGTGIVASIAGRFKEENPHVAVVWGLFLFLSLTYSGTAFVIEEDRATHKMKLKWGL